MTLQAGQTMICINNYLAVILRVFWNKGFNLGDAFSKYSILLNIDIVINHK